jgi:hypothetical protein
MSATHQQLIELLIAEGFTDGWALVGESLAIWEHEQDPPAPLTRPEVTDETSSPD